MKNIKSFVLLQLLLFVYSLGTVASKIASLSERFSLMFFIHFGIQLFILVVFAIGWQQILKKMSLTAAFASKAITIVWGIVFGYVFFKEEISVLNIIAAIIVIVGILFMVKGENNNV